MPISIFLIIVTSTPIQTSFPIVIWFFFKLLVSILPLAKGNYYDNIEIDNVDISLDHSITLENVSFNYDNDQPTLEDINLKLNRDEKILIVGPSGSGKSTLLDIISNVNNMQEYRSVRIDIDVDPI